VQGQQFIQASQLDLTRKAISLTILISLYAAAWIHNYRLQENGRAWLMCP
jgi:hypothetical protein